MNVVCLMGRLTADPEVRQTPNGISVCSFSIAVDRFANGERKADFINCVAWRANADNIARFFKKGSMIAINGSIQTRQYQDKDTGKNRTAFEVLVDRFHFTGNGAGAQGTSNYSQNYSSGYSQPARQTENNFSASTFSTGDLDGFSTVATDDGDLPFQFKKGEFLSWKEMKENLKAAVQ